MINKHVDSNKFLLIKITSILLGNIQLFIHKKLNTPKKNVVAYPIGTEFCFACTILAEFIGVIKTHTTVCKKMETKSRR
jgi:hypothetical protein